MTTYGRLVRRDNGEPVGAGYKAFGWTLDNWSPNTRQAYWKREGRPMAQVEAELMGLQWLGGGGAMGGPTAEDLRPYRAPFRLPSRSPEGASVSR